MQAELDRRTILRAAAAGLATSYFLTGPLSLGQSLYASPDLAVRDLGDYLFLVPAPGYNVLAAGSDDGAVIVDGGLRSHSSELLATIRNELGMPRVSALFNTCWHPDRTGLNEAVGASGARIIAHENTRLWLTRDVTRPWDGETIARLPPPALPNDTFYRSGEIAAAGRTIRYGYLLQAHTDGDMYVHFPRENVLVTGAAICATRWPLLDWWTGGWIGGLIDAFAVLLDVADENTRIVPGEGPLLTRQDLVEQREMYVRIFDRLAQLFFESRDTAEVLAARPTEGFDDRYGNPDLFVASAFRGFGLHFAPDA